MEEPARKTPARGVYILPNLITTGSLFSGFLGILWAIAGEYEMVAIAILVSCVLDGLDGKVARLTGTSSDFGVQFDSLCDLVAFGVTPAILVYQWELSRFGHLGLMASFLLVACGALRLARFNVYQSGQRDSFTGLPIPAAGGTVASLVLFTQFFDMSMAFWLIGPMTLALAFLMVSQVRYPKDRLKKMLVLSPHHAFRGLVVCVVAVALMHYAIAHSPVTVMFPMAMAYIVFGMAETLWSKLRKRPIVIVATANQASAEGGAEDESEKKADSL